jgi:hypothetical protein
MAHADSETPVKTVELEWDAVETAGGYEVKLSPENGSTPLLFEVPENHFSKAVPIGNYVLQMRTKSKDGRDTSEWSPPVPLAVVARELTPIKPTDNSELDGSTKPKVSVDFEWSAVENAREYKISVWSDEKKDQPYVFTTKATQKRLDVPTAQIYHWKVEFESKDSVAYQQEPKVFTFTLLGNRLTRPEINEASLNCKDLLSWTESDGAETYSAELHFKFVDKDGDQKENWQSVKKQSKADAFMACPKLKPGAYKLEVVAKGRRRSPSEPAVREFLIKPTLSDIKRSLLASGLELEPWMTAPAAKKEIKKLSTPKLKQNQIK